MTKNDSQFARDVAKQLDRRRMRRRLFMIGLFVAAIALAITFLTCGRGWGVGGAGKGEGSGPGAGSGSAGDKGSPRCAIRVTGAGILVDGKPATRQEAVAMCKTTSGADVVVTGDARQGDWDELRAALEAAKIPIFTKH
ncbi:hypothetical protein BH11MYX3_BH11MYX3_01110 [soil metagenome]